MTKHSKYNAPLQTERLILRQWREDDLAPYAQLNADEQVRRYFPGLLTKEESDRQARAFMQGIDERGWGLWAVEIPGVVEFAGFIGLTPIDVETPGPAEVEIGWRLDRGCWGQGYATEGAKAALAYARDEAKLAQLASFTASDNMASRRVMEKIGMERRAEWDFNHPRLPKGHSLERHVYYWISLDPHA